MLFGEGGDGWSEDWLQMIEDGARKIHNAAKELYEECCEECDDCNI